MRGDDQTPDATGLFESWDTLAHVLRNDRAATAAAPRDERAVQQTSPAPDHASASPRPDRVFRPTVRRPMALLHVVDDGREDGEIVRMRGDRLVIGRTEGDVVIPHDVFMSPRHACLERLAEAGWRLTDLGSSTGTFVRVDRAKLRHERVIQIGSTRLRFHEVDLTEAWLIEVPATGAGRRHECHGPVTTIGRAGCTIALDDPFVGEVHAEVRRSPSGWRIRNTGANGLWVRIDEPVEFHVAAQFLCGEQRFVFEPLG